ncbi:hypothetical protein CLV91_0257 [Maribacter vaceletii]|uniref:Uncharacterized protein n=1 Tax=Maribacter vaceletii TaxID=1206816 RepID=A0A495EBC1_9FLAO|nr:hypothetical protein CLV91_0257 [Maribacter vaceletii]
MNIKKKKKYTGFILNDKMKKIYQIQEIKLTDKALILITL